MLPGDICCATTEPFLFYLISIPVFGNRQAQREIHVDAEVLSQFIENYFSGKPQRQLCDRPLGDDDPTASVTVTSGSGPDFDRRTRGSQCACRQNITGKPHFQKIGMERHDHRPFVKRVAPLYLKGKGYALAGGKKGRILSAVHGAPVDENGETRTSGIV